MRSPKKSNTNTNFKHNLYSLPCSSNKQQPCQEKTVRQYIFDKTDKIKYNQDIMNRQLSINIFQSSELKNTIELMKSKFQSKLVQQNRLFNRKINQQSQLIDQLQIEINTMKTKQQESEIFNARKCVYEDSPKMQDNNNILSQLPDPPHIVEDILNSDNDKNDSIGNSAIKHSRKRKNRNKNVIEEPPKKKPCRDNKNKN
eukprot:296213_1